MEALEIGHELLLQVAIKTGLVLGTALLTGLLMHRLSAARRYPLWLAAVLAGIGLPLAISFLPAWHVLPPVKTDAVKEWPREEVVMDQAPSPAAMPAAPITQRASVPPLNIVSAEPVTAAPIAQARAAAPELSWTALVATLPAVWLTVALLLLGRIGLSALRLHRLGAKEWGQLAAYDWGQAGTAPWSVAAELGLKRVPEVLVGPRDAVPMVWGVFTPRLLLPEGFHNWLPNKLHAVLVHELAHLKRRDPLALVAAQVMLALHWFNPLAWLTVRRLRADQERACDDAVLRCGTRPSDYAQHLLDLSRQTRLGPGLSLCALAMARHAPVLNRVTAILHPHRRRDAATRCWSLTLLSFALFAAVPLAMLHAAIEDPKLRGRILDRHGVVLAETTEVDVRHYPLKALAAHVIGYTGQRGDEPPEGRDAIEKQFNSRLQQGRDVRLSLDARAQQIAEDALRESGGNGAIVVLDTQTGEVLALASWPAYDPNRFVPKLGKESWEELTADQNLPLFPRAYRAEYPGGEFFRAVTAIAGIAAGLEDVRFTCTSPFKYGRSSLSEAPKEPHGEISLEDALVHKCRIFNLQLATAVGREGLLSTARELGFGEKTGLAVSAESEGSLPSFAQVARVLGIAETVGADPNTMAEVEARTAGDLANLAMGRGRVLVTPVQLAQAASVIANGGSAKQPVLISGATSAGSLNLQGIGPNQLEVIRRSMRRMVAESADDIKANSAVHAISGMMSADLWRPRNDQMVASFVGFAPYEKPKIAFAIVIEGHSGSNTVMGNPSATVARRVVEDILALPADGSGKVEPVDAPQRRAKDSVSWTPYATSKQVADNASPVLKPEDERRWRILQKAGALAELPRGTRAVTSGLIGNVFPRDVTMTFTAPREAARAWLTESPGFAEQKWNPIAPSPANDHAIADSLAGTIKERNTLPPWPENGHAGTYLCAGKPGACSVTIRALDAEIVTVTMTVVTSRRLFLIAE